MKTPKPSRTSCSPPSTALPGMRHPTPGPGPRRANSETLRDQRVGWAPGEQGCPARWAHGGAGRVPQETRLRRALRANTPWGGGAKSRAERARADSAVCLAAPLRGRGLAPRSAHRPPTPLPLVLRPPPRTRGAARPSSEHANFKMEPRTAGPGRERKGPRGPGRASGRGGGQERRPWVASAATRPGGRARRGAEGRAPGEGAGRNGTRPL